MVNNLKITDVRESQANHGVIRAICIKCGNWAFSDYSLADYFGRLIYGGKDEAIQLVTEELDGCCS